MSFARTGGGVDEGGGWKGGVSLIGEVVLTGVNVLIFGPPPLALTLSSFCPGSRLPARARGPVLLHPRCPVPLALWPGRQSGPRVRIRPLTPRAGRCAWCVGVSFVFEGREQSTSFSSAVGFQVTSAGSETAVAVPDRARRALSPR